LEYGVKEGIRGFKKKGVVKGTLGVIGTPIKVINGVFDSVSNVFDGMSLIFEDRPNSTRFHIPRPFYGEKNYYKEYNVIEAKLQ
jgi:hypothetical protein